MATSSGKRVVVVGAGLSGLAAAMHLAGAGHRVTVLERESFPGGRNGVLEKDGFRFDTGPVVFTMTSLLEEAFNAIGTTWSDHVSLKLLDPGYHTFHADGSSLLVRPGHEAMRAEIARECGTRDAVAFDKFVDWLKKLNDVELPHFIDANFNSPLSLLRSPRAALELVRLGGFGRLGNAIGKRFTDDRLQKAFSFQALYAGLAPSKALALYAIITYMDSIEGAWFPEGGMHAIPKAMASAADEAGVEFRYDAEVAGLERVPGGRVTGVHLAGGERVRADAVVMTVDLPVAYDLFLPDLKPPRTTRKGSYSPSAVVWHLGVKGELPEGVGHHNIHFGKAWEGAFTELMDSGTLMSDPSRFVAIPSIDDPGAAPEGHHTLYVLEPVPNLQVGQIDWARETGAVKDRLQRFLEDFGYPLDIVTEEFVTPVDWLQQGMAHGTPFALSHAFSQTGPFRPKNIEKRAPGLVFAGSGTTPGVGIPMVLVSGKLAAQRVEEVLR